MKILEPALAVFLGAVALAAAAPPAVVNYATSCAVIGGSADGYVTNLSTETYHVTGPVRFVFSSGIDMSRPSVGFTANSAIPPGQTVLVARTKLAFQPAPADACGFEVGEAIRKP